MSESRIPNPESRSPSPGSRIPGPESRSPSPESRVPNPESRVPSPEAPVPNPENVRADLCAGTTRIRWVPTRNVHKKPQGQAGSTLKTFAGNLRCVRNKRELALIATGCHWS